MHFTFVYRVSLLLLVLLTPLSTDGVVAAQSTAERAALYDFYVSTSSSSAWSSACSAGGWTTCTSSTSFCNSASSPFTTFYGLTCSASGGTVTRMNFDNGCGLDGTLPASLAALTSLDYFHIWKNKIRGTLAPEWGTAWTKITYLYIAFNLLTGTLPDEWKGMTKLTKLFLMGNDLSGTVPASWPAQWAAVTTTGYYCTATCSGAVGSVSCLGSGNGCIFVGLWYNCISSTFPPSNSGYAWNWASSSFGLGPQRSNCASAPATPAPATPAPTTTLAPTTPAPTPRPKTKTVPLARSLSYTHEDTMSKSWNTTASLRSGTPDTTATVSDDSSSRSLSNAKSFSVTQTESLLPSPTLMMTRTFSFSPSHVTTRTFSSSPSPVTTTSSYHSLTLTPLVTHTATVHLSASVWSLKPTDSVSMQRRTASGLGSLSSSETITNALPDVPPPATEAPIPPSLAGTSAAVTTVGAAGALLGVDPGGAASQAVLTFFSCRRSEPIFDGSFASWLSTLPISPWMPFGLVAAVLGNIGTGLVFLGVHALVVVAYARRRSPCTFQASAMQLRFPSLPFVIGEWLLSGVAVCSVALAVGYPETDGSARAVGWLGVAVSVAFVLGWWACTRRMLGDVQSTEWSRTPVQSDLLAPRLFCMLHPRVQWHPPLLTKAFSTLFEQTRSASCGHWRWCTLAVLAVCNGITGAGGAGHGACDATLFLCSLLLFLTAFCLMLVKPYALPSENVLNPLKFVLLGCTALMHYSSAAEMGLAALGALQALLTVLRVAVKLYLRIELFRYDRLHKRDRNPYSEPRRPTPHIGSEDSHHHQRNQTTASLIALTAMELVAVPLGLGVESIAVGVEEDDDEDPNLTQQQQQPSQGGEEVREWRPPAVPQRVMSSSTLSDVSLDAAEETVRAATPEPVVAPYSSGVYIPSARRFQNREAEEEDEEGDDYQRSKAAAAGGGGGLLFGFGLESTTTSDDLLRRI